MNYIFIQAIQEYYRFYGKELKFDYPTGSNSQTDLYHISSELRTRLIKLFEKDSQENRFVNVLHKEWYDDNFKDLILFYEYFYGDNGCGIGASHQTGWTVLAANLIHEIQ